jgi:nucleotide-binding universal stress UspA family protein
MEMRVVLAALDATGRAENVLRAAASLAARFGAELYVYRAIVVPPEFAPAAHVATGDPLPHYLERKAQEELRLLMASVPGAKMAKPLVSFGDPWRAIAETAARITADVIVMGSHGYRGIDWVIGTTTGRVSTRAPCHVFVVHDAPPTKTPATEDTQM